MAPPGNGVTSEPVAMMMFFGTHHLQLIELHRNRGWWCEGSGSLDIVDFVLFEEEFDTFVRPCTDLSFALSIPSSL